MRRNAVEPEEIPASIALGRLLQALRIKHGLRQQDAAVKAQLLLSQVVNIENGRIGLNEEIARKLSLLYGVQLEELLARAGVITRRVSRYLMGVPSVGVLLGILADRKYGDERIQRMIGRLMAKRSLTTWKR